MKHNGLVWEGFEGMLYKEWEEEWKALKGDKRWEEREMLGEIKGGD